MAAIDTDYWCGTWTWNEFQDCPAEDPNDESESDCWFMDKTVELRANHTASYTSMSPYGRKQHECTWSIHYNKGTEEVRLFDGTELVDSIVRGDAHWVKAPSQYEL
eukprot:TRINITY_DN318_c0_g1_i2.p2 TRINITY_DN318_c0_g1~~TRINITY_DN318_c0_g1_i2.p2  ORF type:complete len:106 (-),score=7.61 TRINITY_DN318_c0_g1_i2:31-348(-)